MENDISPLDKPEEIEQTDNDSDSNPSNKRVNKKLIIITGVLIVVIGILFYFKGLLVAASVDGRFISRLSLISQLEKQGGKMALDSLISEKLIENEVANKGIVVSDDEINQEIKNIEAIVAQQGGTLQEALVQKGMTEEDLRKQIKTQKGIEYALEDKIQITEEEIKKFILDNKIKVTKDKEAEIKSQIVNELRNQKLNEEASLWIGGLKAQAKIKYYVNY